MLWDCCEWRILHALEEQGLGRHGLASLDATTALDDLAELVECHPTATDLNQGSHYGTNHVAQEAIGGNLEIPRRGRRLVPLGMSNVTNGGLDITSCFTESPEVTEFHKNTASFVHQVKV